MRPVDVMHRVLKAGGLELSLKPRPLIRSGHDLRVSVELVLAHLAAHTRRPFTIVQVGAFDGAANDPIRDALDRYDCRAILVEPQPEPFMRLSNLHANRETVQLVNAAISDRDGQRDLYTVEPDGMPEWVAQLASFELATIERHQRYVPDRPLRIRKIAVSTVTFDTLLRDSNQVDVLQIDAEGYDFQLLRLFDLPRRLPSVVNFEHAHLSRRDREEAVSLLIGTGYQIAVGRFDTVAYRWTAASAS